MHSRNACGRATDGRYGFGRTLQRLGRPRDALGYYERFLQAEIKPDADTQKRVNEYMAQARALLGPEGDKAAATDKPLADKPADKPAVVTPPAPPPPAPPPPGRTLLIAGGAVAGVGVIGLLTGVGLYAAAAPHVTSAQNSYSEFDKRSEIATAQSLGLGSTIAYAVGGAALVGGAVLLGLGAKKYVEHRRANPPSASALLVPGPSGATLVLSGAY